MRQNQERFRVESNCLIDEFRAETSKFAKLVDTYAVPIRCDPNRIFREFVASENTKKLEFLKKIKLYISLFEEAMIESIPVIEDKRYVWLFLKRLGLRPPSDLFERIGSSDYIEIYDSSGIQLFANLEFGRIISYSIEETFWHTFSDLYKRDEVHTEQLMSAFAKCFTTARGPFAPEIDDHVVIESFSETPRKATVKMTVFSPVFSQDNKPLAMLGASKIRLLN